MKSGTLPSIAYGFKRCSLKHKIGPQEKFCNNYPPCREVWRSGKKVVKFIGYDAGEHYRSDKVLLNDLADPKYSKWYPLMEWGWDREECIRQIEAAGLPQPGKSSCFFCPSMRAEEIIDLRERYRFEPLDSIHRNGLSVKPENYELVYEAPLTAKDDLESIYTRFNVDRPADFTGHSLSVSDIVVLHQDGKDTAHYCDTSSFPSVFSGLQI